MEFIKRGRGPNFTEADIETVNSYLVWGAVGLHYANQFARLGLKVWAYHIFISQGISSKVCEWLFVDCGEIYIPRDDQHGHFDSSDYEPSTEIGQRRQSLTLPGWLKDQTIVCQVLLI